MRPLKTLSLTRAPWPSPSWPWRFFLLSLLGLTLLTEPAVAQVIGNDAAPLPEGKVRLSYLYIGSNASLRYDASGRPTINQASDSSIQALRVTLGLAENLDMHIQAGGGTVRQENGSRFEDPTWGAGADDSTLRVRWRFVHEDGLDIALLSVTTIPTGIITQQDHLGIGQGFLSQTEDLVARQDFDRFHLWTEAYLALPIGRYSQPTAIRWGANLCLGYDATEEFQPEVEFNFVNLQPGNLESLGATLGLTWAPSEHLALQLAVQHTVTGVNAAKTTNPVAIIHYTF